MAITIQQAPALYQPVYNEMTYVLTSTNTAQTQFSYVADVYLAGSGTYVRRLLVDQDTNAKGLIFVNEIIESYLTQDIESTSGVLGTTANDNSIVDYIVKFGEQYVSGGVLTTFADLTVDSTRYAWNGSYTEEDYIGMDYTDYILDGTTKKFLTNAPTTINTMLTNSGWLDFFHTGSPAISYFRVSTFDSDGVSIGTWDIKNSLTFATTGEYMGSLTAHPVTINALPNTEFSSGVQPVFTGAEGSYTIQAFSSAPAKISEVRTFNIIDPCNYTRWNVLFLNRQGAFDSFTFKLVSKDEDDITREYYKIQPNRLSGNTYAHSLADRSKRTFFTKSKRKRVLNSDWISEAESTWLEELLSSPVVYLEDESNNLIAVRVTNSKWVEEKKINNKLFNLVLELEMWDNYRQRG